MEGYDLDRKSGTSNLQLSSQDIHGYSLRDLNPLTPFVGKSILLDRLHGQSIVKPTQTSLEKLIFKHQ